MATKKKSASTRFRTITLKISPDEHKKLKKWARAYPDKPSIGETAHRLLERELDKDKRGAG